MRLLPATATWSAIIFPQRPVWAKSSRLSVATLPSWPTGSPVSAWITGIFSLFARSTCARIVDSGLPEITTASGFLSSAWPNALAGSSGPVPSCTTSSVQPSAWQASRSPASVLRDVGSALCTTTMRLPGSGRRDSGAVMPMLAGGSE